MAFIGALLKGTVGLTVGAAKLGWGATKLGFGAARVGTRAGLWAVRHPYATLGMGAGAIGAAGYLSDTSPYESPSLEGREMSLSINQEIAAAEAMNTGVAPTGNIIPGAVIRNQRLMESTMNLNFGLHRSRH